MNEFVHFSYNQSIDTQGDDTNEDQTRDDEEEDEDEGEGQHEHERQQSSVDELLRFPTIPLCNMKRHFRDHGDELAAFVEAGIDNYNGKSVYDVCAEAVLVLLNGVHSISLEVNRGGAASIPPTTPLRLVQVPPIEFQAALRCQIWNRGIPKSEGREKRFVHRI